MQSVCALQLEDSILLYVRSHNNKMKHIYEHMKLIWDELRRFQNVKRTFRADVCDQWQHLRHPQFQQCKQENHTHGVMSAPEEDSETSLLEVHQILWHL